MRYSGDCPRHQRPNYGAGVAEFGSEPLRLSGQIQPLNYADCVTHIANSGYRVTTGMAFACALVDQKGPGFIPQCTVALVGYGIFYTTAVSACTLAVN